MRRPAAAAVVLAVLGFGACREAQDARPSPSSTAPRLEGTITVSAASSLTDVFTRIGAQFTRAHPGARGTFNFGSSAVLATQIQQGAPVDTFASADTTTMSNLAGAGLLSGAPHVFARNRLVIVTPPGNPRGIRGLADLADAGTVALCAATAPCGRYAAQVLAAAGVAIPEASVTRGVDARATIASVTTGDADAAVVYVTDAAAAGAAVSTVRIPDAVNAIAVYPIATLRGARAPSVSRAFVAALLSRRSQAVLRKAGFLPAASPTP